MHVGSFSVDGMSGFLGGLTTGATRTKPLAELPKIVAVEVGPPRINQPSHTVAAVFG